MLIPYGEEQRRFTVSIDWKAYHAAFVQRHGGNPIQFGSRLVFEDGWAYSARDYRGPEWPPPKDPKAYADLLIKYYEKRRAVVANEAFHLREDLADLRRSMRERDGPLFHVLTRRPSLEEGGPRILTTSGPLTDRTLEDLDDRLRWLEHDVRHCNEQLEALRHGTDGVERHRSQLAGDEHLLAGDDGLDPVEPDAGDDESSRESLHRPIH